MGASVSTSSWKERQRAGLVDSVVGAGLEPLHPFRRLIESGRAHARRCAALPVRWVVRTSKIVGGKACIEWLDVDVDDENTRSVMASLLCLADELPDRVDKRRNRDRLGDVGLASPFADTLLVSLHGEGGHRDHRNFPELIVLLQPFGHLEA